MASRLASCDPCRTSKLACDHAKPTCGRCHRKNSACVYRDRPFKRRRVTESVIQPQINEAASPTRNVTGSAPEAVHHSYPNPGYLGNSSHTTIFEQITAGHPGDIERRISGSVTSLPDATSIYHEDLDLSKETSLFQSIQDAIDVHPCSGLIDAWLAKGTNLALAGVILRPCVSTVLHFLPDQSRLAIDNARKLHLNTRQPLVIDAFTDIERFCSQFCHGNVRWETLGLFLLALSRAATEHDRFGKMYATRPERNRFRARALCLANECLETALATDQLNDLQLFLHYEVWIAYSTVGGDQSYQSWRKLGDVISALFALGYHEQANSDSAVPPFLRRLRSIAFARVYSGDKNVSIFLGRPPRVHRKYCQIERIIDDIRDSEQPSISLPELQSCVDEPITPNFSVETRFTASCAMLKERVLNLFKEPVTYDREQEASDIAADAVTQWDALPERFRLRGPLCLEDRRAPSHTDLLASLRLNHLHVLFLLKLLPSRRTADLDADLANISKEMLHIVVETVVLKEHLANSGTSLIWKVAYYGLPAAGVLCLALLNKLFIVHDGGSGTPGVIQDLGVLVAHMDAGVLIGVGEANYALLSGAIGTVKSILHRVVNAKGAPTAAVPASSPTVGDDGWDSWLPNQEGRDFELDFWLHLAEHPELVLDPISLGQTA